MKNKKTTEWVNLSTIDSYNTAYRILIGKRSNGKTYAVKKRIVETVKNEHQFVYLRRLHSYITRRKMNRLFEDIDEYSVQELGDTISYGTDTGFYLTHDPLKKTIGVALSLQDFIADKGIPYNKCTVILFDEFCDISYMENEISAFLNVISTIVRKRNNVVIYMLANSIGTYNPYFDLFKIDKNKLKKGCIHCITHTNGVTIALQYFKDKIDIVGGSKTYDKYIGFDDNNTVKMILHGDFEENDCNIKEIDGVGWNSQRRLVPFYITYMKKVFEMSINTQTPYPILFLRQINTQNGIVRKSIKYNLSIDNTVKLNNSSGIVPYFAKFNELVDKNTLNYYQIVNKCIESNRIVFDANETGTYFAAIKGKF